MYNVTHYTILCLNIDLQFKRRLHMDLDIYIIFTNMVKYLRIHHVIMNLISTMCRSVHDDGLDLDRQ